MTGQHEEYVVLDPTTPWFEWLSYSEACESLGFKPSLTRFLRYNAYYRSISTTKLHEE
jgi:hypothetical protein